MNHREEMAYIQGTRQVWIGLLRQCLRELGLGDAVADANRWTVEKAEVLQALKELSPHTDWEGEYLPDLISEFLIKKPEWNDENR